MTLAEPELIRIDPFSDVPVYQQIVAQIRLAVAAGRLHPGYRLEPVRELARRLSVNASTVARSYQMLEAEGIIEANRRRGSIVARRSDTAALQIIRHGRLRELMERSLVDALAHGYTPAEIEAAFSVQLAAWREQRGRDWPGQPAGHAGQPAAQQTGPRPLRFAGSHDLALEVLWVQARRLDAALAFEPHYVGSLDGLLSLLHGESGLAGTHILDAESGQYNLPILRHLFVGRPLCVVTLAEREQGLLVPAGNPRGLRDVDDLAQPGLRFVNRQPGSGTRTLLDYRLQRAGIDRTRIAGYQTSVATHLAVATAVAEGRADAGLGLFAAARAFGLGFVPLARERYDLVLLAADRQHPLLAKLLDLIGSGSFRAVVAELGGYDTTHIGEETCI